MDVAVVDPSSFSLPYDHHLCRGLSELGHDVTLYCGQRPFYAWGNTPYAVKRSFYRGVERVGERLPDGPTTVLKGIEHIVDTGRLVRRVTAEDPDVVHFQWAPIPMVDRVAVGVHSRGRPTVHTVHNAVPLHKGGNLFQRAGTGRLREAFDALIVHTEVTCERLNEQGIQTPATVIPHPALGYEDMTDARTYPDADGPNLEGADDLLLCFGNLRPYKNPELAIRTMAALPSEVLDGAVLLFVGNARMDVTRLRQLADRLGVAELVRWDLRYVPDKLVPAAFRAADVTLLPYTDIDQSGVMMTSLGLGTPVVAAAVGGFPETIEDGVHGRLHEPGDPEAAAAAVADVLSWSNDETVASIDQLVQDRYAPEEVGARTAELYESLH